MKRFQLTRQTNITKPGCQTVKLNPLSSCCTVSMHESCQTQIGAAETRMQMQEDAKEDRCSATSSGTQLKFAQIGYFRNTVRRLMKARLSKYRPGIAGGPCERKGRALSR